MAHVSYTEMIAALLNAEPLYVRTKEDPNNSLYRFDAVCAGKAARGKYHENEWLARQSAAHALLLLFYPEFKKPE
jgi:hypothetical protein